MHDWAKGLALGGFVGLAGGVLLGLLYAPEKGKKTRKALARRGEDLQDRAADVLESASKWVDEGRKRVGI